MQSGYSPGMKILLTNDDGIHAPGIAALYEAVADPENRFGGPLGEIICPIAPLTVQSATSHGVTFHTPLMVSDEEVNEHMRGIAVDGRPADCVKLAISRLWPEKYGEGSRPDLVISGINSGANVGINVIYSGTVAAALEGAFLGIPSIAMSLHISKHGVHWLTAARHARRVLEHMLEPGMSNHPLLHAGACLNVNIPLCEPQPVSEPPTPETPEIVVCRMNTHGLVDKYDQRESPGGQPYYWAAGDGFEFHQSDHGTDVHEIFERRITVTPLKYDLTREEQLGDAERFFG